MAAALWTVYWESCRQRGSPNAATTIAVGNVDAESCLEDEVPLLGRIPGVISVCLGRLPVWDIMCVAFKEGKLRER